ncbi:hypothetical protein [Bacillus sp. FJAT-45350]|uniref:hypothetical protein n=1 Tax=Bacillus sp. FJAT-45350 TaxID=2011014 RepID=UPI000BB73884|nr:hypothetical protein [Bacillus sp. FJAT-45350]
MLVHLISYGLHLLITLIFFVLIPLPIIIKAWSAEDNKKVARVLRIYKVVIMIAHGALIVALVTGLILHFDLTSLWIWVVILLWVAIGAYLGLTAKYVRMTLELLDKNEPHKESLQKTMTYSVCLMLGIISMFVLKYITL